MILPRKEDKGGTVYKAKLQRNDGTVTELGTFEERYIATTKAHNIAQTIHLGPGVLFGFVTDAADNILWSGKDGETDAGREDRAVPVLPRRGKVELEAAAGHIAESMLVAQDSGLNADELYDIYLRLKELAGEEG